MMMYARMQEVALKNCTVLRDANLITTCGMSCTHYYQNHHTTYSLILPLRLWGCVAICLV